MSFCLRLLLCLIVLVSLRPATTLAEGAAEAQAPAQPAPPPAGAAARDLFVTVNKSVVLDSPVEIDRVSVANGEIAEAVVINPHEVLVNGKSPGETSLIIWQQGGNKMFFDVAVRPSMSVVELVRQELREEMEGQDINLSFENNTVFLHGTVKDLVSAERAVSIASTLGKVVNLLKVTVPPTDAQILLHVRFADVDRAASTQLGMNLFSTGAANTIGSISTGQFPGPRVEPSGGGSVTLTDALNVFLFRRDINLGATIKLLQARNLLEILAEPNVLAINGRQASFLAGGEFPYPTLQGGGAGLGAVTIQFREFGVRIGFLPQVTPRGTIRLQVTPEVSSLDFANGLVFQGFNIPALSTRRVKTEIELEDGQSFAIGGLLDNRVTDTLNKVPGLANIPWLGKLFQSRDLKKNSTELLILVTPELVRPIPAGMKPPEIPMPEKFLSGPVTTPPQTPGMSVTGPVPARPAQAAIPVETLKESEKPIQTESQTAPGTQFLPIPVMPMPQPAPAAPAPAPAAPATSPKPSPTGSGGGR